MSVLLVEDDENKRQRILNCLQSRYSGLDILEARSLRSAEDILDQRPVRMVILDMSMPTFDVTVDEDGGAFQATGGQELLRYMKRYNVNVPVVVLTQFSTFGKGKDARTLKQLHEELEHEYGDAYLGTVYYDTASEDWKVQLGKALDAVVGRKEAP